MTGYQEIASVRGVRGYVVISKEDGRFRAGSAQADESTVQEATARLMRRMDGAPSPVTHMTINVPGGRVLALAVKDLFLAIYVGPKFDVAELRTRLKQIEQKETAADKELERDLTLDDLSTLHWATRTIVDPVIKELGAFVAVNALKEHLGSLKADFPCLRTFDVSKDGKIEAQTTPTCTVREAVMGVGTWMARFLVHCHGIVPRISIGSAVAALEPKGPHLEKLGFFVVLERAARS